MKAIKDRKNNKRLRKAKRYPNQAEPGYRLRKVCDAVLTLISSAGIAKLFIIFIML